MATVSLSRDMVHAGNLILINQENPYCGTFSDRELASVGTGLDSVFVKREVAAVYEELIHAIGSDEQITPVSGWRSQQEQEQIYCTSLTENGVDFTQKYVALPGHSEHQTGFALDLALTSSKIDFLRPYFPRKGICMNFRKMAGIFGFIERYPKGKEAITGIAHEPWHFRYVGAPHAMIMNRMGDTLEEYHARLRGQHSEDNPLEYDFGALIAEIFYLPAGEETTTFTTEVNTMCEISGDNRDGFIVTCWKGKGCGVLATLAG
jgi:D-alanyl-D-alanine dipeptidase/carboxypeptidase